MKLYDISMSISHDMPVYKNKEDKRPHLRIRQDFSSGSAFETRVEMDSHTGTHLDAPLHMLEDGRTIETLDLASVMTKCKVLDLTACQDAVTRNDLASQDIQAGDFILLKTRNSEYEGFDFAFVFLDKTGAEYLQQQGIVGVGIDALGIERSQPGHETHKILLNSGIIILEGLRLKDVAPGEYFLCAAPLNIAGAEAAPVRAVLIADWDS